MKLTVKIPFHDKFCYGKIYEVGTVVEFEEERAQSLIDRGLATIYTDEENPTEQEESKTTEEAEEVSAHDAEETLGEASEETENVEQEPQPTKKRGRKSKKD